MDKLWFILRAVLLAGALGWVHAAAAQALAPEQAQRQVQQPYNNAPVWRDVRSEKEHFTTVRGVETGVLIQSGGETWRQFRNGPVTRYGGFVLCALAVLIGVYYAVRGPIKLRQAPTGRMLERFDYLDRFTHWSMAITFVILAVSGLVTLFGKHVLLPVLGYSVFAFLADVLKVVHNLVGPLFLLSVIVGFFVYVKDNLWQAADAQWIAKAGGLFSGQHVPSHRFNFGEKTWFWFGVMGLGLVVGVSGLILDFPNFEQGRALMQLSNVIHAIGALIFIALSLGHIYMGTVGVEGAYQAMRNGSVDETWAKEHHELWYEEVKGRTPAAAGASGAVAQSS